METVFIHPDPPVFLPLAAFYIKLTQKHGDIYTYQHSGESIQ